MDITQALRDAENALRDFIAATLSEKLGGDWAAQCGVSPDRLSTWQDRKDAEKARQRGGVADERIIYYADFYDLRTILKKHWAYFSPALGDWKDMEVWLGMLERLRDPDAHRRELLPHQKHLALGIEGEIRSRLIRYRSKQETEADYFPRIESARDNLGNIWTPENDRFGKILPTRMVLRPGDVVEFVITARDPLDEVLDYGIRTTGEQDFVWQGHGSFSWRVLEKQVGRLAIIDLAIRSSRSFHASRDIDDRVELSYTVLPPKTT